MGVVWSSGLDTTVFVHTTLIEGQRSRARSLAQPSRLRPWTRPAQARHVGERNIHREESSCWQRRAGLGRCQHTRHDGDLRRTHNATRLSRVPSWNAIAVAPAFDCRDGPFLTISATAERCYSSTGSSGGPLQPLVPHLSDAGRHLHGMNVLAEDLVVQAPLRRCVKQQKTCAIRRRSGPLLR